MKKPARTSIVYCRTSSAQQRENETIGAQVERCKRIVELHGLKLPKYGPRKDGWIVDDGVSGSMLEGRAFAAFVEDLRARRLKIAHLVVFNLSRINRLDKTSGDMERLVRSHEDNGRIKAVLIGAGVTVIDEEGENDPRTNTYDIKTAISVGEYNDLRTRTMAGKVRRASEGAWSKGGRPPYGYKLAFKNGVDRKAGFLPVPHPEEAPNLRQIFRWYIETGVAKDGQVKGGVTYAARRATEAGYAPSYAASTKRRDATTWWPSSIVRMIQVARMYALGEQTLEIGGEPHTVKFPPIIDGKLFAAVQRRSKQRTLKHRAPMLTTGFVDCECGAHVHARNAHGHHLMRCANACGAGGVREEKFSAVLWTVIVCRLIQIEEHERNGDKDSDSDMAALKTACAKIEDINAEIARLLDVYLTAGLDKALFRAKNEALNDRKAAAQAEVERIERERAAREQKRANQQSVEARVGVVLRELARGEPGLETKRQVLRDLLNGERVIVSWPKKKPAWAAITLPAFGDLPPITVRTDQPPWSLSATARRVRSVRSLREGLGAHLAELRAACGRDLTADERRGFARGMLHAADAHSFDAHKRKGPHLSPAARAETVVRLLLALAPKVDGSRGAEYERIARQVEQRGEMGLDLFARFVDAGRVVAEREKLSTDVLHDVGDIGVRDALEIAGKMMVERPTLTDDLLLELADTIESAIDEG
jgi:DNA invertase Pin-like site-specific DNA recombinase